MPHINDIPPPTVTSSVGTILGDIADSTQALVRQEIALVRSQLMETLKEQAQTRGKAAAILAAGGILALIALVFFGLMLLFGLMALFDWSAWVAALIVTLLYLIAGGALAFWGKQLMEEAPPPTLNVSPPPPAPEPVTPPPSRPVHPVDL